MSEQTNKTDEQILIELKEMWDESLDTPTNHSKAFDHVLSQGGSLDLLHRVAIEMIANDGLPYIAKLLTAGYEPATVRLFLAQQCFGWSNRPETYTSTDQHRHKFWVDAKTWDLFTTPEQLTAFLEGMAERSPEDTLLNYGQVAYHFGELRDPQLRCAATPSTLMSGALERCEQALVKAGMPDATLLLTKAAEHVGFIHHEAQLQALKSIPNHAKVGPAVRLECNHLGLIFKGYVLASQQLRPYDASCIRASVVQEMEAFPHRAVPIYRWLLEGVKQAEGLNTWRVAEHDGSFRHMLEGLGWKFLKLTGHDNRRYGRRDLQIVINLNGRRHIITHVCYYTDGRGESLREGDEVIFREDCLDQWQPDNDDDGRLKFYRRELYGATPPTHEMKKDPRRFFYIEDPRHKRA